MKHVTYKKLHMLLSRFEFYKKKMEQSNDKLLRDNLAVAHIHTSHSLEYGLL